MRTLLLIVLISVLGLGACKKCKDLQHVERTKLMAEYFGSYKPGAYWIYLNRDSTKRDSIWVDNFEAERELDNISCITSNETFFDMHCTYLDTTKKLRVCLGFNGDNLNVSTIEMKNEGGDIYGGIYTNQNIDTFYALDNEGSPRRVYTIKNFQLWNSNSIVPLVTVWGRFIIAPEKGIVQYMPLNSFDTFSLVKNHTP